MRRLPVNDVQALLARLREAQARPECRSCDCLQGFLAQLEMDADPAAAALIAPLKVASREMHGCLGCEPCPPGAAYADYLQQVNACREVPSGGACACECSRKKE